jgi:hypothetical protein
MRSMNEDVDANKSGKELPLLCWHNQSIPFCSRSKSYYRSSMIFFEVIGKVVLTRSCDIFYA